MRKTLLGVVSLSTLTVAVALTMGTFSCGRPSDGSVDPSMRANDYTPVDGLAAFGTQCPHGDVGSAKPLRLQMWSCPISEGTVHLNEDLAPLYFEADCKNRILSIRTLDHKIDTSWYFLPNGEFDVVVDGLSANLRSDGNGHSDCKAPLAAEVSGHVTCGPVGPNQDNASIKFQSVMWAGKKAQSANPAVQPSPTPGLPPAPAAEPMDLANQCNLPSSCYFYTQSTITQCQ